MDERKDRRKRVVSISLFTLFAFLAYLTLSPCVVTIRNLHFLQNINRPCFAVNRIKTCETCETFVD